jgi:hypothetical protein
VYHFGQGDLSWLQLPSVPATVLYLSRGVMLLMLPIVGHLEVTAPIIFEATGVDMVQFAVLIDHTTVLVLAALVQHLILVALIPTFAGVGFQGKELLLSLALGFILLITHPLVGFGIYFGIWHALNHFFELRDHLWERFLKSGNGALTAVSNETVGNTVTATVAKEKKSAIDGSNVTIKSANYTNIGVTDTSATPSVSETRIAASSTISGFWWFYRKTIPFTLLSFVGLAILWILMDSFGVREKMISLLFIMISVLTLPHMVVVHYLFSRRKPVR